MVHAKYLQGRNLYGSLILFFIFSFHAFTQTIEEKTLEVIKSNNNISSDFLNKISGIENNVDILFDAYVAIKLEKPLDIFENRVVGPQFKELFKLIDRDINELKEINFPKIKLTPITKETDLVKLRQNMNKRCFQLMRFYDFYEATGMTSNMFEDFDKELYTISQDMRKVGELYREVLQIDGIYGISLFLKMGLEKDWHNFEVGYPFLIRGKRERLNRYHRLFTKSRKQYRIEIKSLSGLLLAQLELEELQLKSELEKFENEKQEVQDLADLLVELKDRIEVMVRDIKDLENREEQIRNSIKDLKNQLSGKRRNLTGYQKELNRLSSSKHIKSFQAMFPKCPTDPRSILPRNNCCPNGKSFEDCDHPKKKKVYMQKLTNQQIALRNKIKKLKRVIEINQTRIKEYEEDHSTIKKTLLNKVAELEGLQEKEENIKAEFDRKLRAFNERISNKLIEDLYSTNLSDKGMIYNINKI